MQTIAAAKPAIASIAIHPQPVAAARLLCERTVRGVYNPPFARKPLARVELKLDFLPLATEPRPFPSAAGDWPPGRPTAQVDTFAVLSRATPAVFASNSMLLRCAVISMALQFFITFMISPESLREVTSWSDCVLLISTNSAKISLGVSNPSVVAPSADLPF